MIAHPKPYRLDPGENQLHHTYKEGEEVKHCWTVLGPMQKERVCICGRLLIRRHFA